MILGIDYGRSHLGLALSEGSLAEPFLTLDFKGDGVKIEDIEDIADKYGVTLIVLGVSEGKMGQETKLWGKNLANMVELPVEFVDETLSSVEAGVDKENHAKAAAVILQRYLDEKHV